MSNLYKIFLILAFIKSCVGVLGFGEFQQGDQYVGPDPNNLPDQNGLPDPNSYTDPNGPPILEPRSSRSVRRWRVGIRKNRGTRQDIGDVAQQLQAEAPPKPPRGIPRDTDDLIDGSSDDSDLEQDIDDEQDVKCIVEAQRPYGSSPTITLTGIKERFNSLLIGYDTHSEQKRANKGSLYGWSSPKMPDRNGISRFSFDIDYASILPQGGTPLSYCALVFVPPIVPKFDMRSVFGRPVMSNERYIGSEEHLVKALKKKSRKVTSCCFVAYPITSRR